MVSPSIPSSAGTNNISLIQVLPISMIASELIMPKTLKTQKEKR
jgi:hypothetical protein